MSEKRYTIVDNERSSSIIIKPTAERTVSAPMIDGFEDVVVDKILVICAWKSGGYRIMPGFPIASVKLANGQSVWIEDLLQIPEWLGEIIAAGTPTDLEHPAA